MKIDKIGTALCGDNVIVCDGREFVPDRYTAFVDCRLAHVFPVIVGNRKAFHPAVIQRAYKGMLYKVVDIGHIVRAYNPTENARDRIVGTVVAVEIEPGMGMKVTTKERSESPGIRAICSVARAAEDVETIIKQHQTGRTTWTVSLEVDYRTEQCGLVVPSDCGETSEYTPDDLRAIGYEYWPAVRAPEELFETIDPESGEVTKKFRGVWPTLMLGGLGNTISGTVYFKGIGLTPIGKEPEARIATLLAGQDVAGATRRLGEALREILKG